jgi:hypothetical protein
MYEAEDVGEVTKNFRKLENMLVSCLTNEKWFPPITHLGKIEPRFQETQVTDGESAQFEDVLHHDDLVVNRSQNPDSKKFFVDVSIDGNIPVEFMLANVGVRCKASDDKLKMAPEGTDLITVISGDADYIKALRGFLDNVALMKRAKSQPPTPILKNDDDPYYQILKGYEKTQKIGAETLSDVLSDENKFVAYSVKVRGPEDVTFVPIPTRFERDHKTRVFLVVSQPPPPPPGRPAESLLLDSVSLGAKSSTSVSAGEKSLIPLLEFGIVSHEPGSPAQVADIIVRSFAIETCWYASPSK